MDPVQSLWRFQNLIWNGLSVRLARTIVIMFMENADPSRCESTNDSIDPEAHGNWRGHSYFIVVS